MDDWKADFFFMVTCHYPLLSVIYNLYTCLASKINYLYANIQSTIDSLIWRIYLHNKILTTFSYVFLQWTNIFRFQKRSMDITPNKLQECYFGTSMILIGKYFLASNILPLIYIRYHTRIFQQLDPQTLATTS